MIDFVKNLQREINRKIEKLERTEENSIKKALQASHILGDAFDRLKKFIKDYRFRSEAEEIEFFKEIKPRLFCRLIYYRKIYNIEMNRPIASIEAQIDYLRQQQQNIDYWNTKRLDFIRYYKAGSTYLDQLYFLRGQTDTEQYLETFYYELDPLFSTNCDFKVAKLLANESLSIYLLSEIKKLEAENYKYSTLPHPDVRLVWQGPKVVLQEFIFAVDTAHYFGDVPLTQVNKYFSTVFNVDLDPNISRAFTDMKIRNNPTSGLEELVEVLKKRMEQWKRNKK